MFESIALALAKALATYLFKYYVMATPVVKIEGAPGWYYKESSSEICVFANERGGYNAVDALKGRSGILMAEKIDGILQVAVYDNYRELKDPKEKEFVKAFMKDAELPVFITKTMKFRNIVYDKDIQTAFSKACIEKNELISYQEERLEKLKYSLSHERAGNAFDELEESVK
ncbi:MAG: hypothetical protein LRY50_11515 [Geovibrio sp.]|uniref:hypothetical protein n=1 Tax=Geovibrio ferrireducens TaxID=46201 RepID=UPI0022475560|nr:hypothetical protein [Geovibrio ferrireducens]MCD8491071.1 hypothetical protein [Geovibrio sp.]MCD8568913.1 hypothetical protein [Geovibrio sp.]